MDPIEENIHEARLVNPSHQRYVASHALTASKEEITVPISKLLSETLQNIDGFSQSQENLQKEFDQSFIASKHDQSLFSNFLEPKRSTSKYTPSYTHNTQDSLDGRSIARYDARSKSIIKPRKISDSSVQYNEKYQSILIAGQERRKKDRLEAINKENEKMLNQFIHIETGQELSVGPHDIPLEKQIVKSLNQPLRKLQQSAVDYENLRLSKAIMNSKLTVQRHNDKKEMGK